MIEVLLALLLWGGGAEPRLILDVEEEVAALPALPTVWEDRRIAFMSDWQIGLWLDNTGMIDRAIDTVIEERPAAVLIAGDFIYDAGDDPTDEVDAAAAYAARLTEAGIPTFAVLGNHDYGLREKDGARNEDAAALLAGRLRDAGVRILENEAVALPHPDAGRRSPDGGPGAAPLYLVGIGSYYADNDDPIAALRDVPFDAPRIAFMHHPSSFREIPAWNAPVALAGHRHGGQFRIPIVNWSWLRLAGVEADGWADETFGEFGNRLYITRGIGMSFAPIRINCPPELTFLVLRGGGAAAAP